MVTLRYGMREDSEWIRGDLTEIEMTDILVAHFSERTDRCWGFDVENERRDPQTAFKIETGWRYTLEAQDTEEPPRQAAPRPTVKVKMRHRGQVRQETVPEGTDETGMRQLLTSGFGKDVRKRWRVTTRNRHGHKEPYELKERWSYELEEAGPAPPEEEPREPRRVMANTRYDGLRVDIELDASWSERQVHEAGGEERHRRPRPGDIHGHEERAAGAGIVCCAGGLDVRSCGRRHTGVGEAAGPQTETHGGQA
jgi:hypothetical protein